MIFTLEALEAKHGDSLLLHYGEKDAPKLIIIDGGPKGVFKKTLRPRLEEIKGIRSPGEPLPVKLVMISHIDDDHIKGILDLTKELLDDVEQDKDPICNITIFWHNSFDDILGNKESGALSAALRDDVKLSSAGDLIFPPDLFKYKEAAAVAASVGQGRELRSNVEQLGLLLNQHFKGLVALKPGGSKPVDIDGMLSLTVVGPSISRLKRLEADWDQKLPAIKEKEAADAKALAASIFDDSVYNLSSIVVLVEAEGKKMLLTGDALGEDVVDELKEAELLDDDGNLHVDILKMPHHGSIRNCSERFLRSVTAEHYVMSANGKYSNPDTATLELLSEIRGEDVYRVHLTNPVPHAVEFYKADMKKPGKNYTLNIRDETASSLKIDLGEPYED
jgi:glyoxylase-like metal-dependent hydrolase (beta-lactamase superfamily II)